MPLSAILMPVFLQAALTFGLSIWMFFARRAALVNRSVKLKDIALGQPAWPAKATQIGNSFHNQLETPQLFYAVVALSLATAKPDAFFVALEWLFVAFRFAHAYVHCGGNDVRLRGPLFGLALLALIALWLEFAWRILVIG